MNLSVIIPALNEAAGLPETLGRLRLDPKISEIVVSDGGSSDGTTRIAAESGAVVVSGVRGRGAQCRAGAERATGDALLFLHADTWLPSGAGLAVLETLEIAESGPQRIVGGAFSKRFHDAPWYMRGARFRSRLWFALTRRPFADQGIFVRADSLESIGGFPAQPLMEEFELVRRLERVGRVVLLPETVTASARRFRQHGVLRTYFKMADVLIRHALGASPEELRRRYEGRR